MATLSESEIESLRFQLGYGNVQVGAYPHTPDGFKEVFRDVIAPNLSSGYETTVALAIAAGVATVTPASMTGIVAYAQLIVDVGDDAELVSVRSVTPTTFSARFSRAHAELCPIATMSGISRLRHLLREADAAWKTMQAGDISARAGIQAVDEVTFFQGGYVLAERKAQWTALVAQISQLVRVQSIWQTSSRGSSTQETY